MIKFETIPKPFQVETEEDRKILGNGFTGGEINYDYMNKPVSYTAISEKTGDFLYEDHPEEVEKVARHFESKHRR